MKYKYLRAEIKKRSAKQNEHVLKDCQIVIDARSYFSDMYKKSGCQFILGGEYDRYAHYLKNTLNFFIESNITCYVIFNGAMHADLDVRMKIHQNNISKPNAVEPNVFCEPIFVKDVNKEVLKELGIKYFVSEYDPRDAIFSVAKKFNCPVLTNNIEYTLYGVSCVTPSSMVYNDKTKSFSCIMYKTEPCKLAFFRRNFGLIPIFLTLTDEDSLHFNKLHEIISCGNFKLLHFVVKWLWVQNIEKALGILKNNLNDTEMAAFLKALEENDNLCKTRNPFPINYFERKTKQSFFDNDCNWFAKGVADGRIAVPYINLKNKGTFSGSWLIFDKEKEEAMLSAMDIVMYVYGILTNSPILKITFIGRKSGESCVWEIEKYFEKEMSNEALFETMIKGRKVKSQQALKTDLFKNFLDIELPGFNFDLLSSLPEDCWILILTLVYYCKRNKDFIFFAHSVMLCYVMLGPVSEKAGVIKRSNFLFHMLEDEVEKKVTNGVDFAVHDCAYAVNTLLKLFYVDTDIKNFDRRILHTLAEFQHCLQHMNYLNKLCGEKIKCTIYHKAFNATFVYNVYLKMKSVDGRDNPMKYFEDHLDKSPVLEYFKMIQDVFDNCLLSGQSNY